MKNKEISLIDLARAIKEAREDDWTKEKVHRRCIQANSLDELLDKMEVGRDARAEIASRFVGRKKEKQ
jgi:hypothetical protein